MTFALGAGSIRIDVTVSRGQVCAVAVSADRPQGLAQMFVGRRPQEAPQLAGRLFSLCGFGQSTASTLAVAAAKDEPVPEDKRRGLAAGVLAERVFETLRALVMQWPTNVGARFAAHAAPALRKALAASQSIIAAAARGVETTEAVTALEGAASVLGAVRADASSADTLCGAILAELRGTDSFPHRAADALSADEDPAVVDLMRREAGFCTRPHLAGRVVETGAYARLGGILPVHSPHLAARFSARLEDVRESLDALRALAEGKAEDAAGLMCQGELSHNIGFGAVECARGRLYHEAEIGADGRLSAYRMLAPTEWNFHPAGPFVETLLSSRIGEGETARTRVSQLAALFDPCVAFEIRLKDAVHA
ncbi:nickel-dependent hydrogenase large subunit [Ciceribacter ferrooxidans]|uniref:Hydrogenase assembly protein HupF n=1 Tax=Ciceribacter ferrooxidans TaxID=2509717 RepID=A0A4V1RRS1_9HYPH|nr:nickel-dependent hydrogenase large subunit [Ciceribacter ferrooxidans]RYC17434.1 hydrogenase assembly protein HupF [Ciceribacter ferrooxidans]